MAETGTSDPTGTTDPTDPTADTGTTDPTVADTGTTDPTVADTGTGGDACAPEADDDECSMCTKTNCCDELTVCTADPDCDCAVQCISAMGIGMMEACLTKCELEAVPETGTALLTCVAVSGCLAMGC